MSEAVDIRAPTPSGLPDQPLAHGLTEAGLLRAWEEGLTQSPVRRALTLAMVAAGDALDPAAVAELPVGHRNALLLALRERCFGPTLPCAVTCPRCAEGLDVTITADELRTAAENVEVEPKTRIDIEGFEVTMRAVNSADLLAVDPSAPDARRALLARCVVDARRVSGQRKRRTAVDRLPDRVLDAVAVRLHELDPQADAVVPLDCPECGHAWRAALDIAGYVWAEIEAYARRLIHEVCVLATTFGWTEADVLAVSPTRRRLYLEAGTETVPGTGMEVRTA